jgi:NADH-quinone oxidoreductase subunit N
MQELSTYAPALPEIALAAGALLILMLGAFRLPGPADYAASGLAIVVLLVAAKFVVSAPDHAVLFDGAFVIDGFGRFMKLLVLGGSILVIVMSVGDLARAKLLSSEYVVLLLLSVLGMMLMISAGSLISLYLGLELQSLALYVVAPSTAARSARARRG